MEQRKVAIKERSLRVMNHAKYFYKITHVHDTTTYGVEIQVTANEKVNTEEVVQILKDAIQNYSLKEHGPAKQFDAVFYKLSEIYTNNDINLYITDSNNNGFIVKYNNTMPIQVIKV